MSVYQRLGKWNANRRMKVALFLIQAAFAPEPYPLWLRFAIWRAEASLAVHRFAARFLEVSS